MTNPYVPDAEDVQGVEDEPTFRSPVVPVVVEGPVRVQQLPSRGGDARNVFVQPARKVAASTGGNQTYRRNADPRRKRVVLISTDQPFFYGFDQESVESGSAALWPINVPLVIEHCGEYYLASNNSAGSTISIIREDWAL
jgi:hypothetical protein